ncbi:hypothetical protein ACH5RR_015162 [Cinchona calisaya]|uniref:Protein E6-like n=1 Tax=Cinchona calisaya TaxID=153742 RepID=A0ABD2ZSS6_9GENT
MASLAKHFILILLLLTLLSSFQIHARDSQFFTKIPSNNGPKETEKVVLPNNEVKTLNNKQDEDPNFIPENENGGYGLYGHESGQLPPSTTTKESYPVNAKYLPKNYNTKAYVTEPEGYRNGENQNSYYNNDQQQQGFGETKLLGSSNNNRNKNYNNNNNNYYNGQQQEGMSDTRFNNDNNNNYYSNYYNGVDKQGMSDTRFLENGKYFHDVSTEQNFNRAGPYGENVYRGYTGNNNGNSYVNRNNYYNEGYQNQQGQFQNFLDEEDLP